MAADTNPESPPSTRVPAFPTSPQRRRAIRIVAAELADAFGMAISAVTAHRLRSSLTLLGVLVGVFSIIVVMTAMRVL